MTFFARLFVAAYFVCCAPAFASNMISTGKLARMPVVTVSEIVISDDSVAPGDKLTFSLALTSDQTTRPGIIAFLIMNEKDRVVNQTLVAFSKLEAGKPFTATQQMVIGKDYPDGSYAIRVSSAGSNFSFWKLKQNAFRVSRLVESACGKSYNRSFITAPATDLCAAGQASGVSLQGADFLWSCTNAIGLSVNCKASKLVPVDSVCGAANGTLRTTRPSDNELCAVGAASIIRLDTGGNFHWSCFGLNGGTDHDCAAVIQQPVTYGWAVGAYGEYGSCSGGKQARTRSVQCMGSDQKVAADSKCGGERPIAEDTRACTTPIDGQCGPSNTVSDTIGTPSSSPYTCLSGQIANLTVGTDIATWTCLGQNGGADTACKAKVAAGVDIASLLGPMGIPPSNVPDVVGAFRFLCGPGQVLPDDPIVYPGQPGRAHLHQFFGNLGANANSTYESLRASGDSTCMNELNRSAYWMPAMLDGRGNVVRPDNVSVYYKRRPKSDPFCTTAADGCVNIPRGLRLIFGWDQTQPTVPQPENVSHFNFKCVANFHPTTAAFPNMVEPLKDCKVGQQLVGVIQTPVCWDGHNLDSPDHRSHVVDMIRDGTTNWQSQCPATHPKLLPQFTMGVQWTIGAEDDPTKWTLSSDHMKPGALPGETFHSDYFEGWEESIRARWHAGCIDHLLNCSDGDLGDGQIMTRGKFYPSGPANPRLMPIPVTAPMVNHAEHMM